MMMIITRKIVIDGRGEAGLREGTKPQG